MPRTLSRKRALSKEGFRLYLNASKPVHHKSWLKRMVHRLFKTNYDDYLLDVVYKCMSSTRALAGQFENQDTARRLDSAIRHTTRIVLTGDKKKVKKRQVLRTFRFFMDVMDFAYRYEDYQTVNMLYLALTHPAIQELNLKMRQRDIQLLEYADRDFGPPSYAKHIEFWKTLKSRHALPSLIAFSRFIDRREFIGAYRQADEAKKMMELYQFLPYDVRDILPLYNEQELTNKELQDIICKLNIK